ncbi:Beta-galactosidase C-terminal domain [Thermus tengchongensis]|uniref:Beta-galactosidase C-terminal domain n=1 Tax=Thermus tengchongensis TaxID=1214928 RepID=UPI000AEA72F7|nr:Beta-galactosidase C-terminal domain [Thermus tengchongensis]
MRLLALALALLPALAQPLPQVRELTERELYWFLVNRTQAVQVVGLPPASLGEALKGKRLTLVLGRENPPAWAQGARVYRLGGRPFPGGSSWPMAGSSWGPRGKGTWWWKAPRWWRSFGGTWGSPWGV